MLKHSQTGYCDKAVQSNAYAAYYAARNAFDEYHYGINKSEYDTHNRSGDDSGDGSVTGDGHATDRFAISRVGATAYQCAGNRTDAVAEQRAIQSGIFEKIVFDNR